MTSGSRRKAIIFPVLKENLKTFAGWKSKRQPTQDTYMLVKVWSVQRVTELHRLQKLNDKLYTGEKDNSIIQWK